MKKNIRKMMVAAIGALALVAQGGTALAWGPERPTFTNETPASYVTFNSITNNAGVGDETNFVRVRKAGEGVFVDAVDVEPGQQYEVYIYYHNNAAGNLNLTAENTRVFAYFPGVIGGEATAKVGAMITADNASPKSVWDEATFKNTSDVGVTLEYVAGSAKIHNAEESGINGASLPDTLFQAGGTLIGYSALDGKVPGCAEYSGYITYTVEVKQASVYLSKMVSKDGENYYDNINANVGDTIYYKVVARNEGDKEITDVVVSDELAAGLQKVMITLDDGTETAAELFSTATGDKVLNLPGEFFGVVGVNVNALAVGGQGWFITYKAKITDEAFAEGECSAQLINTVFMDYSIEGGTAGSLGNQAAVTVKKACNEDAETATEMPKTGGDAGEMLMTVLVVMSATGGAVYALCGINLMRRKENVVADQSDRGSKEI